MAQWKLSFRVDVERLCNGNTRHGSFPANAILRAVSKVDPRPLSAVYENGCVEMSFIIAAENLSEAHGQQCRIHDSLSKAIDEAKLEETYAIEFDPPQEIEEKPRVI